MGESIATREAYGNTLVELGEKNENIVVLDADLSKTTYTCKFAQKYPERFFDMGIAEQNMMGTAAGLSTTGKIPFASTFAVFATGRAYDQVRNSICYPNLNVKIAGSHGGFSAGEDGGTHQTFEDIAIMRVLPNMHVLCPCDEAQTKWAVETAVNTYGPFYIRLSRPPMPAIYEPNTRFELGKAKILKDGKDITIMSMGLMLHFAFEATKILEEQGVSVRLIDMHTIKPIDTDAIINSAKETKHILTVEEHSVIGGLGEAVCSVLAQNLPTKVNMIGIEDKFGTSGNWKDVLKKYGLTTDAIVEKAKAIIG